MKRKNLLVALLFTALFVMVCYQPLSAGWIIKSKTTGEYESSWNEMYLQNNVFKMLDEGHIFIINGNTRDLTFVNVQENTYWKGNLDDFKNKMKEFFGKAMDQYSAQMEEAMKNLTPEQRAMMEQMGANNPMLNKMQGTKAKPPVVDIVSTGEVMTIAKRSAKKYIIKSDGKKMEEVWLAENMISSKDWNPEIFRDLAESMRMGMASSDYEDTDEYWSLHKKGIPLKTVYFQEDYTVVDEVVELTEKNLPASTFAPPSNCREVSLEHIFQNMEE
ncbi:DUF4412 domain-containing protein [Marinifilum sp. D714]|uniref:DUF4412 domain-containing protein n=1 Tax=Marinifilum sp. D714 TaxID=2937523 RepID=UPI0027CA5BD6|nr:DUF4412 domain-containing protein [Marinifilum sp. D714]MDQ2177573.1 DUF4412 domain-containing protein [Marinifilum sp. D714]